jgi:glycosyltransferase involved in cell wall biosynthesis
MHSSIPISAFIVTRNEEKNIEECLKTLVGWCADIHLVDSCSTDATIEIAKRYGVQVVIHPFEGHAKQRAWALKNLPFRNDWVLALDADHRLTPELQSELVGKFQTPPRDVSGFFINRRQIFRGRWMRHGAYFPKYMLKLFRLEDAFLDEHEFDFRFYVRGRTEKLVHHLLEANNNEDSISFYIEKHVRFATAQAEEELKRRNDLQFLVRTSPFGNPDQRTLWLKRHWYRAPLYVRPVLLFGYRYFIRLGFLDGKEGFIFYFLQSFWYRLLVDIRMEEMMRAHPNEKKDRALAP